MSDPRPTLADLRGMSILRHEMEQRIVDALHADPIGFTIPCDECAGLGWRWSTDHLPNRKCRPCSGLGVLSVGIIDRPAIDVEALREKIRSLLFWGLHSSKAGDAADMIVEIVKREFGVIDGTTR